LDDFGWTDKVVDWMKQGRNSDDEVTKSLGKVKSSKNVKVKNDFIGIYADKWFGEVEVYEKDKQLWFKSNRSPKLNGPMAFYNANTFAIKWEYQAMNCDALCFHLMKQVKRNQFK
jgi:hypothetical protein